MLLSPACGFWVVGACAWLLTDRTAATAWWDRAARLTPVGQLGVLVVVLLLIAASGVLAEQLARGALPVLQGYWPRALSPLRKRLVARQWKRKETWDEQWAELYAQIDEAAQTEEDGTAAVDPGLLDQLLVHEQRLTEIPGHRGQVMPTRLGNVLRAGGTRVHDKYGLDAVRCWPTLWLLLPETTRTEVAGARTELDSVAVWWTWTVLLTAWTVLTPWALLLALGSSALARTALIASAVRYADLVGAVFDVHRGLLYEALGRPRPATPQDEITAGRELTAALLRGPALAQPPLTDGGRPTGLR
ncbi:hypothetical protein [Streptomyces phaeochromogenes]|uniref:hypothetical protein n=1 Tax=Streptomyces phaeochromogenes TaxID=1923 RepID=UPI0012FF49A0|nr:hypothetical protein [Streptomyces phaeochromogenes]